MHEPLGEPRVDQAHAGVDDPLLNYKIQFGSAVIGYLMVGLTVLILLPGPGVWLAPALVDLVCLAVAVFARLKWGWRGFLTGALLAIAFVTMMQLSLLWFMHSYWPKSG
jgi:hypothetical protein